MNLKCGKCGRFAPLDTFRTVPGTNEFVCEDCFGNLSVPVLVYDAEALADPEDDVSEDYDDGLLEETIRQKADRIWRQMQIGKLEQEQEMLEVELADLRDAIGYDRITMDEEDCLVAETLRGFQVVDRLKVIEQELDELRKKP